MVDIGHGFEISGLAIKNIEERILVSIFLDMLLLWVNHGFRLNTDMYNRYWYGQYEWDDIITQTPLKRFLSFLGLYYVILELTVLFTVIIN